MIDEKHTHSRFRWLVSAALIFIVVFFGTHYLKLPLALVGRTVTGPPSPLWLGRLLRVPLRAIYAALYPIDLLFTSLPVYLALSAIGLALCTAALALARPAKLGRAALMLGLLAVFALPSLYRYKPAVVGDPKYALIRVPTQPGPLAGVTKAMQAGAEVRRCDYKLLGWSEQDALFGEEVCGSHHRFWVYWPMSDRRLQTVSVVPVDLFRQEVSREQLRAEGISSCVPLDDTLRIVVREPGLSSRAGWWYAFVARHIYGPEDVVVMMR